MPPTARPGAPSLLSRASGPLANGVVSTELSASDPLSIATRLRHVLSGARVARVLILSSDTGGGHRASAAALSGALLALYPGRLRVHTADFWVDFVGGACSDMPAQYAFLAKHPFLWKVAYEATRFPPIRATMEATTNVIGHQRVRKAFEKYSPDLVISVHPLVNTMALRVLNGIQADTGMPRPAFVTCVTDLGGCHPTWMHRGVDALYIPTDAVREVSRRVGVPSSVVRQFGLPVREHFWTEGLVEARRAGAVVPIVTMEGDGVKKSSRPSVAALREKLGLCPDTPALLVVGGGDGVGNLGPVAKSIAAKIARDHGDAAAQMVVVCGKNETLRESLTSHTWKITTFVQGYVDNMHEWMRACDVLCTKAGPGTIAEGLICGMPILITGHLPGQEAANVKYIVSEGIGEYSSRPAKIGAIASRWIADPAALAAMSSAALREARPDATLEIATDIWDVATSRMADTVSKIELREKLRAAQATLARSHALGSVALSASGGRVGSHVVANSQLLLRMRVLLRVVFGSVIAAEAAGYRLPSSARIESASIHRTR